MNKSISFGTVAILLLQLTLSHLIVYTADVIHCCCFLSLVMGGRWTWSSRKKCFYSTLLKLFWSIIPRKWKDNKNHLEVFTAPKNVQLCFPLIFNTGLADLISYAIFMHKTRAISISCCFLLSSWKWLWCLLFKTSVNQLFLGRPYTCVHMPFADCDLVYRPWPHVQILQFLKSKYYFLIDN